LSAFAGRRVYVAFRYQALNGGQQSDGPFVDDLHVRANYRAMLPVVNKWMLTLAKSVSSDVVMPGQSLVYSLTVNNTDPYYAAPGVTLNDTLPVSTTFVSADGAFSYSNGVVTWLGLTVPAGGSVVRHLTVTVPSGVSWGSAIVNKDYAISVPPDPQTLYGLPVTATVPGTFFDDFSDPSSGWMQGEYTPPDNMCTPPGKWRAGYESGRYGVNTVCAWNGMLYPAPVRLADPANFTLEADLASNQADLWFSSYGVFFNASEDLHQTYIVRLFQGYEVPEWAAYYWPNFQGSSDDQPPPQFIGPMPEGVLPRCWTCNGNDFAWNHIVIQRQGPIFEVWMGTPGHLARMAVINDARLVDSQHVRVGVHHANFEWRGDSSPSWYAYLFDNFRLTLARR
jgi:uncharacterized repeat protein (TIGR01451 family)